MEIVLIALSISTALSAISQIMTIITTKQLWRKLEKQ